MIQFMLVDDESIIVDSLHRLLEGQEDLPLKVWKAYSADEALDLINIIEKTEAQGIDILMSDVMMPGMNGLDLSALIKSRFPELKTLFLSGYSDYTYLQTALHQEAFDYLLKPVDDETVIEAVRKLCLIIEEERRLKEQEKQNGMRLKQAQRMLNDELLRELLEKPLTPQQLADKEESYVQASLSVGQCFILLNGKVDQWPLTYTEIEKMRQREMIMELMVSMLQPQCSIVPYNGSRHLVWLLQVKRMDHDSETCDLPQLHWYLSEELERVQFTIQERMGLSCSFVISGHEVEWLQIGDVNRKMGELLDRAIGLKSEIMQVEQAGEAMSRYQDIQLQPQEIKKQLLALTGLLEAGEFLAFMNELRSFFETIRKSVFLTYERQSEIFITLAGLYLSYMNSRQMTTEVGMKLDLTYLTNFNKHTDWQSFGDYCVRLAEILFLIVGDDAKEQKQEIAEKVDNYIIQNLSRNLTLQQLADHVHLSKFYLSRLYHSQRGYPIYQKIKEQKLNRAKELLLQDDIKIKDVAAELGFENVPYFTTFFRNSLGMSPKEYKQSYQS